MATSSAAGIPVHWRGETEPSLPLPATTPHVGSGRLHPLLGDHTRGTLPPLGLHWRADVLATCLPHTGHPAFRTSRLPRTTH